MLRETSWGFPADLTNGELIDHYPDDVIREVYALQGRCETCGRALLALTLGGETYGYCARC